jgi:hypothetical protein
MSKVSDTTAAQARRGKDIQGIPWDRLQFTREKYRETRLQQYKNYVNLLQPDDELEKECKAVEKEKEFYHFRHNTRSVKSTIVHFQVSRSPTCVPSIFALNCFTWETFGVCVRPSMRLGDGGFTLVIEC